MHHERHRATSQRRARRKRPRARCWRRRCRRSGSRVRPRRGRLGEHPSPADNAARTPPALAPAGWRTPTTRRGMRTGSRRRCRAPPGGRREQQVGASRDRSAACGAARTRHRRRTSCGPGATTRSGRPFDAGPCSPCSPRRGHASRRPRGRLPPSDAASSRSLSSRRRRPRRQRHTPRCRPAACRTAGARGARAAAPPAAISPVRVVAAPCGSMMSSSSPLIAGTLWSASTATRARSSSAVPGGAG